MKINIIGGGAAGLVSALYLRKIEGAEITLYEKQTRDEYGSTPCGEGISLDKLERLETETGFDPLHYISRRVKGIELICPNGASSYVHKKGAVLNRTEWQRAMIDFLEEKGVELRFDQEVENIDQLEYDFLVGAEGPISKTRQRIGGSIDVFSPVQYKMELNRDPEYLEFYADEMFDSGYGWVFSKGETANVGCEGGFEVLDRFLEKHGIKGKIIEKQAYPIGIRGTKLQEGNIYLIGGAGGLTNAVSGDGLSSIVNCAELLKKSIQSDENYEKMVRKSPLDPAYWGEIAEKTYQKSDLFNSNELLNSLGEAVDEEDITDISLRSKLKMLKKPKIIRDVRRLREGFSRMNEHAW